LNDLILECRLVVLAIFILTVFRIVLVDLPDDGSRDKVWAPQMFDPMYGLTLINVAEPAIQVLWTLVFLPRLGPYPCVPRAS